MWIYFNKKEKTHEEVKTLEPPVVSTAVERKQASNLSILEGFPEVI